MNIENVEVGFTNLVNVGRCAYIINCKKDGVFINSEEIIENGQGFNYIVFKGDDPLYQKQEVAKICKKLIKINPRIKFDFFVSGFEKPIEISGYSNNSTFYVRVPDKSNPKYKVDVMIYSWFAELGANFIFDIKNLDDLDNAMTIANSAGIKKAQVFLMPLETIENLHRQTKFFGVNLAPQVEWGENE